MTRTVMMLTAMIAGLSTTAMAVPIVPDSFQGPVYVSGQWIEEGFCTYYERGAEEFRFDLADCGPDGGEVSGQLSLSVTGNSQQGQEFDFDIEASETEYRYAGIVAGDLFEFQVFTRIVDNFLVVSLTEIIGGAWLDSIGFNTNCGPCEEDRPDTVVPEPASMALIGMGLAGLGLVRRRREREIG